MIRQLALAASVLFSVSFTPNLVRDPIGEVAAFQLDKSASRTTSLIKSGTTEMKVAEFVPDHEQGPSYNVDINYDLDIQFQGPQTGSMVLALPAEFFQPSFMENLRARGTYDTPNYKFKHEGYADAKTMFGGVYPHCDKVLVYDIKNPEKSGLAPLIYASTGTDPHSKATIENLKIRAQIFGGIPVMGAVKLDLSGVTSGISFKMGFDYKP